MALAEVTLTPPDAAQLRRVLIHKFDMHDDDASELTDLLIDAFANQAEVNDEMIDSAMRSVFYTLEARKILCFRRIEYEGDEGQRLRGFFWRLRAEAFDVCEEAVVEQAEFDVYATLPGDAWADRQHA